MGWPQAQPPASEQQNPYFPPGPQPLAFEQFAGIRTDTSRAGVKDEEMYWCDGFMPIGPMYLRTLWGVGPKLFTTPATTSLVYFDFANVAAAPYMIAFPSNGSVWATNVLTGSSAQIAAPATITTPTRSGIAVSQWGSQYVIIVAKQTNGYFLWDGTTFYSPGGSAPGGGTMPTGIGGTTVETYTGRVWVGNGATVAFSAPGSVKDFSSANGGGNFTSTDSFLRVGFTQLKQTNGFLYLIADCSINYISGVATAGTPPVTTFTNQNADPEIGTTWAGSLDVFSRNLIFANSFGVHVSYGAAVTKVSDALDGIYTTALATANTFVPSAAKAIMFGKKVWMLLLPIVDPITGVVTNKLLMWNGKLWWAASQDVSLQYIAGQEWNSNLTAYGTDGSSVYPLFQTPSTAIEKTVQSKLWSVGSIALLKTGTRIFGLVQYIGTANPTFNVSVDNELGVSSQLASFGPNAVVWTTVGGLVMNWTTVGGATMTWLIPGVNVFPATSVGQTGVLLGLTISTNSDDSSIVSFALMPEVVGYRG